MPTPPPTPLRTILLTTLLGLTASSVGATTWEIPSTTEEIRIDAVLDDPAWQSALVFRLEYETDPRENVAPQVETECRLVHSRNHLYFGCHAWDPDPSTIRARYSDRDRSFGSDDTIGLAVDPFHLNNNAFVFDINPLGIQNDRVFSETLGFSDPSWDALWDSAGRIVDDGYVVEAKIPFASLRFPRSSGEKQTWGFNVRRYRPRDNFTRIAIHPHDRNNPCRLCQSDELIGFADVDQGHSLEITPTLVAIRDSELDEFPDGDLIADDPDIEPGIFASWGITPNLNLSGTLNPDFSQVEADNAQLDVNVQDALFFRERRPFFLEGADFFDSFIRAIYTRTIADPDWGIKLTGQQGRNGIGVLAAQDAQTNVLLPGPEGSEVAEIDEESLDAALRYRRDIGEASTLGLLLTGRDAGDYSNLVAGLDTQLRLTENDIVEAQYLASSTEYPLAFALEHDQSVGSLEDHALRLSYRHQTRNWTARTSYRDFGEDFRADLGFVPRVDRRMLVVGGNYTWFTDTDRWWTRVEAGADWDRAERGTGELLEEEWEAFAGFNARLQSYLFAGGGHRERVFEGVAFDQDFAWVSAGIQPTKWLDVRVEANLRDAIDFTEVRAGEEVIWSPALQLTLGRHLQGSLVYTVNTFDLPEGRLFEATIAELRAVYQINARAFLRLIGQYTTLEQDSDLYSEPVEPESDQLFGQFLFSYRLDARTALYLGYTSGFLEEAGSGLTQTDETLFFKISYAWTP